jgi:hypothetical protein
LDSVATGGVKASPLAYPINTNIMGEIADMMIDGTLDCITGEYLGNGHGYPRTREEGYSESITYSPKQNYIGVASWLHKRGFVKNHDIREILVAYATHLELPHPDSKGNNNISVHIQGDFNKFTKWFKTYIDGKAKS